MKKIRIYFEKLKRYIYSYMFMRCENVIFIQEKCKGNTNYKNSRDQCNCTDFVSIDMPSFMLVEILDMSIRRNVKEIWRTLHVYFFPQMKEMGIPDHLTCLLRNLYAGQEATVRARHGTTDWFQIGKGMRQGCILSPCLFNFYAEYIMRNAGLEEAQAGIKIAGRNINSLR